MLSLVAPTVVYGGEDLLMALSRLKLRLEFVHPLSMADLSGQAGRCAPGVADMPSSDFGAPLGQP